MSQQTRINWGIISTGAIARAFARGLNQSKTGRLVAVASRSQESADRFAAEFPVQRAYASYEALLTDPSVQAVYIATPHPMHAEWAIRAARAGKHILCEKPAALNHPDLMAMLEAAHENNVFFMEAFMYRCHPQTARLLELIRSQAIGQVRLIHATFSFHGRFNPDGRLFNNALGGGAILDIGCYTVSMSRLIAGAATGANFADPLEVWGVAHLGETGVDEWAVACLKFPADILAQLSTGISLNQHNVVRIFGSEGNITIPNPWLANRTAPDIGRIIVQRNGEAQPAEIVIDADVTSYSYEADVAGKAILAGQTQPPPPAMSWDDSLGNMRTMDRWRQAIHLVYESEKPEGYRRTTVAGEPLRKPTAAGPQRPGPKMKYGHIAGVDRPVSRLVMGVDNQKTFAHAAIMFDDYFERGGNTFDTAWGYGSGVCEQLLGQWIRLRGVRNDVNIIVKGAHTPFCNPRDLTRQLLESLERLQIDQADIYLMHRDNPEISVAEFVEVLNEHQRAGRIRVFGGSNWTLARIEEANEYAARKGLSGFSVLSNNFSLARMIQAPWKDCLSASDPQSRAWLTRTQMPLLSWSSQARGFFVPGRAHPDKRDDSELVRCWYSEDNFQRLARVNELASKKNVPPISIALAYVLHQPFPTFALIGPRLLSETRTSFEALSVELTPQELRWLNLEQ
ncbi:aldo/keto reductase [Fontivita pretiosa]|uniref:aldo/keto reductase n=1 Tax=Fontivita pretiosa TaxID=2989684 RepID=UPI003D16829E